MLAHTAVWFLRRASAEVRLVNCLSLSSWRPAEQLLHLSSPSLCTDSFLQAHFYSAVQRGCRVASLYCTHSLKLTHSGVPGVTHPAHSFTTQAHSAVPDYFDVLGLQHAVFSIDTAELEKSYRALQFKMHPDKCASGTQEEQDNSAEQSMLINQAYAVLKSPLKRALYLLELQGALGDLGGEHTVEDIDLLQRVMEVREQVEATADKGDLAGLRHENRQEEQSCVEALSEAFKRGDIAEAAVLTKRLRYITRIGEAIREKS